MAARDLHKRSDQIRKIFGVLTIDFFVQIWYNKTIGKGVKIVGKFDVAVTFTFFDGGFERCRYTVTSTNYVYAIAMAKALIVEKFEGRDGVVNVEWVMQVE